jgi:hypothetical protein
MIQTQSIALYLASAILGLAFIWFCGFDARRRASGLKTAAAIERAEREDTFKKTTAQIVGAGAFVIAFAYTLTKDDQTLEQTRAQLAASTYAEGVKLLKEKDLKIQAAGIYLIERVAALRPEYRDPISHTLVALIKDQTPPGKPAKALEVGIDVRAAIRVLGRTAIIGEEQKTSLNLDQSNLAGADLSYLTGFAGNRMHGADLRHANFQYSNLSKTGMSGAEMNDSGAFGPSFSEEIPKREQWYYEKYWYAVQFDCADLSDAQLDGSGLVGAIFGRANLARTNFETANLSRADFTLARNIELANFKDACADTSPLFPTGFNCPLRKCNAPKDAEPKTCKFDNTAKIVTTCKAKNANEG